MMSRRSALSLLAAGAVLGGCGLAIDRSATLREGAAESAYPPTGRILRVNGRGVHAHVEGSGPDLVLLHGASGNTRDFTFDLVGRLAPNYRVIVFDRPGLGWSDSLGEDGISPLVQADVLREAAGLLGVTKAIVLGHSYGGAVAMGWALRDPGGVAALVIVAGATMPWPGGLGAQYTVLAGTLGPAVVPLVSALVTRKQAELAIGGIFSPDPVPKGYADHVGIGLSLRRGSLRDNARQVNALKPHLQQMVENYPRLTMPVELLHGDADTIVPANVHARALSKILPDAALTILPGVGHMPHHADPQAVVDAVDRAARRARLR